MPPITTVLKVTYKEGLYNECLQWMQETAYIASNFDGFLEKEIFTSAESERVMVNIFTFRDNECLQRWEHSAERMQQAKKNETFIEEIKSKTQLAGLAFMFPTTKPAKRWKMVATTIIVLFILLNTVVPIIQQFFTLLQLPGMIKSFFGVTIMVSLMTFVILPFLSLILGRWLMS